MVFVPFVACEPAVFTFYLYKGRIGEGDRGGGGGGGNLPHLRLKQKNCKQFKKREKID